MSDFPEVEEIDVSEKKSSPMTAESLRTWLSTFISVGVLLIGAGGAYATLHVRLNDVESRLGRIESSVADAKDTGLRVKVLEDDRVADTKHLNQINQRLTAIVCKIDPPHCNDTPQ